LNLGIVQLGVALRASIPGDLNADEVWANMTIFISYLRADSTYLIGRIKDWLIFAFGEQSVFRDHDDISARLDFRIVLKNETIGRNVIKGLCQFQ
jgi:hypothetical protein